jgi:Cft2 family RNA processing exonuclease
MFSLDTKGIKIDDSELYLDAHRKVGFSFISHGHSDHLKNHDTILTTPATARFCELRTKVKNIQTLNFFEKLQIRDIQVQLYPAGHMLGSAMIRIEKNGQSLLYTGDFRLGDSWTAEKIEIPQSDILIMESTYGSPEYANDHSRSDLLQELVFFIESCFRDGCTPVVLAYSLGKSQEVMKALGELDFVLHVHRSAWELAHIYQEFGIVFKNCGLWHEGAVGHGEVLILPPHIYKYKKLHNLARVRTVFLSGWAQDTKTLLRFDHAIPLSDHSDFNGLVQFIQNVRPQKIYTTHGFDLFPRHLRQMGYDAELLESSRQPESF